MTMPNAEMVKRILPNATEIFEIKTGGQKTVFRAKDNDYGTVVVKIMLPDGAGDRLNREIDIVSSNDFPNVPKIYNHGTFDIDENQCVFIIEQYIEGFDLRGLLNKNGRLTIEETIGLIEGLLETVTALEMCGVVHRDIKPENILCSTDGKYWLLDFGIARDLRQLSLTDTAAHFGPHTAGYAAPEQFRNMKKKIDARADLFSIGVVAYEALTGNHPFAAGARDYLDILRRTEAFHVSPLVIKDDTNGELSKFIHLLMEKYPSRRPPSAKMAKNWFDRIAENMY
jgi:serine/threonine-protein kinase